MKQPVTTICTLSFPRPSILLVTLCQPSRLNCLPSHGHLELASVWDWLDDNPDLSVGILTGSGKAFCVGADLQEWSQSSPDQQGKLPSSGFGGISCRSGRKPIIAAVNGLCVGGATEMIVNCDIVVASTYASFSLPDVKVGLTELGGCLPRLVRAIGRQRAAVMALTGRAISAQLAREWGLVYSVTPDAVAEAIEIAEEISSHSPDALFVTRKGLLMGWNGMGVDEAGNTFVQTWWPKLQAGKNSKEGIAAFLEKRKPKWVPSKL
ncbi:hypothetical protein N7490_004216 [Penicillium lividum]|nr:hypothetical protein N7490_004216 [Penicillium lividum]